MTGRFVLTPAAIASLAIAVGLGGCAGSPNGAGALPMQAAGSAARSSAPGQPDIRVFNAGTTPGFLASAVAWDIAGGPHSSVWFTDIGTTAIGKITSNAKFTEFTKGLQPGAEPYSIVAGPDSNMWFTDKNGYVGRVMPGGTITEFSAPGTAGVGLAGIVAGTDGAMWTIAVGPPPLVVRVALDGKMSALPLPSDLAPDGTLAIDAAGNLWFLAVRNGYAVVVERIAQGALKFYRTSLKPGAVPCCPNYPPKRMTIGPDGHPWFTTLSYAWKKPAQLLGTVASGKAQFFRIDRGSIPYPAYASGIATANHNLWLSGDDPFQQNGALWLIGRAGKQTAYPIPFNPAGLTADASGNLWFTSDIGGEPSAIVEWH